MENDLDQRDRARRARLAPDLRDILDDVCARMAAEGRPVTSTDLVCSIMKHGRNLGARLVTSFGVDLPEPRPATRRGAGELAADAVDLLDAAARVAAELRHPLLATEHVVIATSEDGSLHAGVYAALGLQPRLLREQLARLRANPDTTDLLAPEVDPAFVDRIERALHLLADAGLDAG